MSSLTVNLLPPDVLLEQEHRTKLSLINKISVSVLVLLTFFTSATLTLRIAQSAELTKTKDNFAYAQERITTFKDKEEQLVILKRRLGTMQSLVGSDAKKKSLFNLILFLTPLNMQISDIAIEKKGTVSLSVETSSLESVEKFVADLGNKEKNSDLISKVDLDSFSSGRNGIYYLSLKIALK